MLAWPAIICTASIIDPQTPAFVEPGGSQHKQQHGDAVVHAGGCICQAAARVGWPAELCSNDMLTAAFGG